MNAYTIEYKVLKVAESCATDEQKQNTADWAFKLSHKPCFTAEQATAFKQKVLSVLYGRH